MSIARWDPFHEASTLQRSINRLFDESFRRDGPLAGTFPVDIYETADELVVQAEVPGTRQEDVAVQVQGTQLTIRTQRRHEVPQGASWLRQETAEGESLRSFNLGLPIRSESIVADYRDGILTVHLPKADEVRPRSIPIRSGQAGS